MCLVSFDYNSRYSKYLDIFIFSLQWNSVCYQSGVLSSLSPSPSLTLFVLYHSLLSHFLSLAKLYTKASQLMTITNPIVPLGLEQSQAIFFCENVRVKVLFFLILLKSSYNFFFPLNLQTRWQPISTLCQRFKTLIFKGHNYNLLIFGMWFTLLKFRKLYFTHLRSLS